MAVVNNFLFYLDVVAPLTVLCLTVLLFYFKKKQIVFSDYLLIYFLISQCILNTVAPVFQSKLLNNHWLYHVNSLITIIIFTLYFLTSLNNKKIIFSGLLVFLIFWLVNIVWLQHYHTFNSYSYSLGAFLIVLLSLLNFRELIIQIPVQRILSLKSFWILSGLLTYFGSCFFIFISYNYLSEIDPQNVGILWRIHNIFLAVACVLFFKAIACKQWIQKSS